MRYFNTVPEWTQIHCGACMENFETVEALSSHLDTCPAVAALLPLILIAWSGQDSRHNISHFIQNIHKNTRLIKRYAHSISDEMCSLERSKIHGKLCDKLCLDYNKFRPFESSKIKKIPTRKEAEEILWDAIGLAGSALT